MDTPAPAYLELVFDLPSNQVFTYAPDPKGQGCIGKRAAVPFGKREMIGYIIGERTSPPEGVDPDRIKPARRIVDKEPIFASRDIKLAEWIAGYYFCSTGQALAAMIPSGRRTGAYSSFTDDELTGAAPELSDEQHQALEAVSAPNTDTARFYLYGITGSGKTEVFLRAAEIMLNTGKSVIYLVPEISLTHQTVEAIRMRFGSVAATIHSGMSPSARLTEWVRIKNGEIRVVVGPRSAVFAPVQNLGLIIIDEARDGSY